MGSLRPVSSTVYNTALTSPCRRILNFTDLDPIWVHHWKKEYADQIAPPDAHVLPDWDTFPGHKRFRLGLNKRQPEPTVLPWLDPVPAHLQVEWARRRCMSDFERNAGLMKKWRATMESYRPNHSYFRTCPDDARTHPGYWPQTAELSLATSGSDPVRLNMLSETFSKHGIWRTMYKPIVDRTGFYRGSAPRGTKRAKPGRPKDTEQGNVVQHKTLASADTSQLQQHLRDTPAEHGETAQTMEEINPTPHDPRDWLLQLWKISAMAGHTVGALVQLGVTRVPDVPEIELLLIPDLELWYFALESVKSLRSIVYGPSITGPDTLDPSAVGPTIRSLDYGALPPFDYETYLSILHQLSDYLLDKVPTSQAALPRRVVIIRALYFHVTSILIRALAPVAPLMAEACWNLMYKVSRLPDGRQTYWRKFPTNSPEMPVSVMVNEYPVFARDTFEAVKRELQKRKGDDVTAPKPRFQMYRRKLNAPRE